MLILTRRVGDTVVIGNEVFCTVLEQQHDGQIKLAFDAPKVIPIHRFEIQTQIMQKIKEGTYTHDMTLNETVIELLTSQFNRISHWN
ncbi:carbon storage regulator [Legionella steelei]|uniref:Carbon storage regulator n=1 Tax=Legionella steelei TaxID=947033 RepID=A0A0W0ZSE5_9GAMM|nr:carbon storage regulator [Legionella steelei]KTD71798.1 carbon storage regulator [Legionella steelei]